MKIDNIIKNIITSKRLKKHQKLSNILMYVFVNVCKINQKKYYILGSYALRDDREINDLDINLDDVEFIKLGKATEHDFGHIEIYNNQIRWVYDLTKIYNKLTGSKVKDFSIEAFMKKPSIGFPTNSFSLSSLKKNKGLDVDQNKHQFMSTKTLLKWKKKMNRDKDQDDIAIIKDKLRR